eukprot:PITA_34486
MHIDMGDDSKYSVTGVGTITFQRDRVAPLTLKNVMHVPRQIKKLVSIAMHEDRGYDVIFSKGKEFLQNIAMGQVKKIRIQVQNLYKIEVEDCATLSSKVEKMLSRDIDELWHRQLGHFHHGALKILHQISTGLPKGMLEQLDTCKHCTFGKYTKSSFGDRDSHVESIMERVHSDVCGPFSKISIAKHSGEDVSNEFKNFCVVEGIKRELTAPHNPQQNGVSERKNRRIVGQARVMLHDQGLPLHLWVEACNTTVYVQNHSPHQILDMKTIEEAHFGKRPNVDHFNIFGS